MFRCLARVSRSRIAERLVGNGGAGSSSSSIARHQNPVSNPSRCSDSQRRQRLGSCYRHFCSAGPPSLDVELGAPALERSLSQFAFPDGIVVDALKTEGGIDAALNSVVKIFTVSSSPSYFLPWQNKPLRELSGSGFVISGRKILTNAHVVADHSYVLVRKHGSPTKFRAKVLAVGHECDLALLLVEDENFWDGIEALELGDVPFLQDSVAAVGYPQGGDNICVTRGVVSRVEPVQYIHGGAHLIAIQIDAAINPGNSGGPAMYNTTVVGVVFQNLSNAENVGYIIPVPVIKHFLSDVEERGKYIGFCSLGIVCQPTENKQLRDHLKMQPPVTGVLVSKVYPLTEVSEYIKKDDVLVAFDGMPIANDGSVIFRNRERISFVHFVTMKREGETGVLRVLRDGTELDFCIKLAPVQPLVPNHQFERLPSYYIFAGLVFVPLTLPFLHEYGEDWYNASPRRLCDRTFTKMPKKRGEQYVIMSQVLVDDINAGYERLAELQVKEVNGEKIVNLEHLKHLVESCKEKYLRFDLDDGRVIVLDFEAAKDASVRILQTHRIPSPASPDLLIAAKESSAETDEKFEEDRDKEIGIA